MTTSREAVSGMLVVRDPDDGSVVGEVAVTSTQAVEQALERGWRATRRPPLPAHERARILREVANSVAAGAEWHANLIAREGIKTIREARLEVARAVETLRLSAGEAKRVGGEVIPFDQVPAGEGRLGWWTRAPAGLVVAITPYNDPLNLVAHKIGPAMAAGAPVILKPHPQTPFSALKLVEHFHAAGAPEDLVQIVIGDARTGGALVSDVRPRVISFTGGSVTAGHIARAAGIKHLMFELGGVGLVAVAEDAAVDAAARAINSGAFWAAGQNCVRAQRVIVDRRLASDLLDRLTSLAGAIKLGPKLDEGTDMGPIVDTRAANQLEAALQTMCDAGAEIVRPSTPHGNRTAPTWVHGLPSAHPALHEELFGPISTFEIAENTADIRQRIATAPSAIHAAIFTNSLNVMLDTFKASNAAAFLVNDSTDFRIDAMPFGGVGSAGLGREGVSDAVESLTEKRMIIIKS